MFIVNSITKIIEFKVVILIMNLNLGTDISMNYNVIFIIDGNLYTLKPTPKNVASNILVVKKKFYNTSQ